MDGASCIVTSAIKRCPFLHQLATDSGEDYAASVAVTVGRPTQGPVLPEALTDYAATFRLFHGASGVVPLVSKSKAVGMPESPCPYQRAGYAQSASRLKTYQQPSDSGDGLTVQRVGNPSPLAGAPLASLSSNLFRFMPGPGDFIARRRRKRQERQERRSNRKPQPDRASGSSRHRFQLRAEDWRLHPVVGGLIPLNAAGRYACPPLVVAGRQAVARWRSVQFLRPKALPVKLLGVGGHCLAANVPCGAVREHTEKFSAAWFVAVHATVPFFAFMRKGVGMPKWAILLTLAAAVIGQTIGAKLEGSRLQHVAASARQREQCSASLNLAPTVEVKKGCPLLRSCGELSNRPGPGGALLPLPFLGPASCSVTVM